jgi:hypothetical protein
VVGGLLVAPRPSQAQQPGAAPIAAPPTEPSSAATAGDRSPRAPDGDQAGPDKASPSPEEAVVGLPTEVSLAELFPAEAAMGAGTQHAAGSAGATPSSQGDQVGPDSGGAANSRWPLLAGMVVTLAILFGGGGLLWWRSRDSAYWPA